MNTNPRKLPPTPEMALDLGPSLEPMRDLLAQFIRRRLRDALGWRMRLVTSIHTGILRDYGAAITCRICVVASHKTTALGITTAPDLQAAIETSVERVAKVIVARTGGTWTRAQRR